MAEFIANARRLVEEHIPRYRSGQSAKITVGTTSHVVIDIPAANANRTGRYLPVIALWAESTTGEAVQVDLRLPEVKRRLRSLVEQGPGVTVMAKGVKWQFIERKPVPPILFSLSSAFPPTRTRTRTRSRNRMSLARYETCLLTGRLPQQPSP